MTDFEISLYRREDIPALKALWAHCFGDPEEMVDRYFEILPRMGFGLCAYVSGQVAGAAYMIEGMSHVKSEESPCAYLYAVGVFSDYRGKGLGSALSQECKKLAMERGAKIICTQPAKDSLYNWYAEIIGTKHTLFRKTTELKSAAGTTEKISAKEYALLREELLLSTEHMRASEAVIEFQQALCKAFGGDLFRTENGIAAAYIEEGKCYVKELLSRGCPEKEAAAVGYAMNLEDTVLFQASPVGDKYLAFESEQISKNCVWNISFD